MVIYLLAKEEEKIRIEIRKFQLCTNAKCNISRKFVKRGENLYENK